jgi:protein-L-isoaspartate O-methyltransferase
MVVPVGSRDLQTMALIYRRQDNKLVRKDKANFKFVPLVGEEGWGHEE